MLRTTNKIDLITGGSDPGLFLIVEAGEWAYEDAGYLLQEKLNAYLSFGLDGEMEQRYGVRPKHVTIRYEQPPPQPIQDLISTMRSMTPEIELRLALCPAAAA